MGVAAARSRLVAMARCAWTRSLPGPYYLDVRVRTKEDRLPWESPEFTTYMAEFSVPEIPGGVSDEPLDLGNVTLKDVTVQAPTPATVKPPAPQAPGEKSVGTMSENVELLRYVVVTRKANMAKIQTWQGRATLEKRFAADKGTMNDRSTATTEFVFDRARKSLRWNTTLDKWTTIRGGKEEPQPVPQIFNGMITPEAFYRVGSASHGWPANPAKRPLTMTIYAVEQEQLQPQLYDLQSALLLRRLSRRVARRGYPLYRRGPDG